MPINDETPRVSDRTTESLLKEMLDAIFELLDDADDSQFLRELRARAESYAKAVAEWDAVPPSPSQRDAAFDHVVEIHTKIVAVKGHHPVPSSRQRGGR